MPYAAIIFDSDYLEHHGVKGQKWGVRRYQKENSQGGFRKKIRSNRIKGAAAIAGESALAATAGYLTAKGIHKRFGSGIEKLTANSLTKTFNKQLARKVPSHTADALTHNKRLVGLSTHITEHNMESARLYSEGTAKFMRAGVAALAAIGLGAYAVHKFKQNKQLKNKSEK